MPTKTIYQKVTKEMPTKQPTKVQIMQRRALYIRYQDTIIVKSTDIEN